MEVALAGVRRVLLQGLQSADTREVSDRLVQFLHERLGLSLDLSSSVEENQQSQYITSTSSSQEPRMVTTQVVKRFFEAVLHEGGYDSWQVAIDPKTSGARIESGLRQLFLPDTSLSVSRIRHLLAHELAGHVARSFAGECSSLGLLGMNTKGYMPTEEGIALYQERQATILHGQEFDDSVAWVGTLATGLASGVVASPLTFTSLYSFFEIFRLLVRLIKHLDKDIQTAREKAQAAAFSTCLRTYRGVPDLTQAGICYTTDVIYLRGLRLIEKAVAEDANVLDRLAVGKIALELLPDVQQLGIIRVPQPLRTLASNPNLESYILSFQ